MRQSGNETAEHARRALEAAAECRQRMTECRRPMFLCVCQYGHSRSVALCRVLHKLDQSAIAAGWMTSGDWLPILAMQSHQILLLEESMLQHIPPEYRSKVVPFDVGPDRWVNPYHRELETILRKMVFDKLGLGKG